jgi:hypothetical protein
MSEDLSIIIYSTADGKSKVDLTVANNTVWMNQKQLAELFDTSKQNISLHIENILKDNELDKKSVVKEYLTTENDNKNYKVNFYALEMILAIGYRVRSKRGVQFRIWATNNLKEYMIKGFVVDDNRLKNPNGRLDYFDELLEQIRDIRASEKRFYQKIKDLFSLSSDYDKTDKSTQMFFAEVQNKLLYATTKQTAAELIVNRADENKPNMALTNWQGSIVRKQDIYIAKNYLSKDEIDTLNRLVVIFLETAELRAKDNQDITITFWRESVDKLLEFNNKEVLQNQGKITKKQMEEHIKKIYNNFDSKRKISQAQIADAKELAELQELEQTIKNGK